MITSFQFILWFVLLLSEYPGGIFPIFPDVLHEAGVGLYSQEDCDRMYVGVGGAAINDGHICVGQGTNTGACSVSNT